jgi:hypothetical protein
MEKSSVHFLQDAKIVWNELQNVSNIAFRFGRTMGQDSSVGIANRYGVDGTGIEFRWCREFSPPVQTGPGAHPDSYKMGSRFFPGVKRPGRGVDHSPHLVKIKGKGVP